MRAAVAALVLLAFVGLAVASETEKGSKGTGLTKRKSARKAKVETSASAGDSKVDSKDGETEVLPTKTEDDEEGDSDSKDESKTAESDKETTERQGEDAHVVPTSLRMPRLTPQCIVRLKSVCVYGGITVAVVSVGTALFCRSYPSADATALAQDAFCRASTSLSGAIESLIGSGWEPLVEKTFGATGLQTAQYWAAQAHGQCTAFFGDASRFCNC